MFEASLQYSSARHLLFCVVFCILGNQYLTCSLSFQLNYADFCINCLASMHTSCHPGNVLSLSDIFYYVRGRAMYIQQTVLPYLSVLVTFVLNACLAMPRSSHVAINVDAMLCLMCLCI